MEPGEALDHVVGAALDHPGHRNLAVAEVVERERQSPEREGGPDLPDGRAVEDGAQVPHRRRPQFGHGGHGGDPAGAEQGGGVRHGLHLGQHVGGEEHGGAGVAGLADDGEDLLLHERVETGGGLVEDEELGAVHERLDEPELLLVALGERAGLAAEVQFEPLGQGVGDVPRGRRIVAERGPEVHLLAAREPALEMQFAGEVADAGPQLRAGRPRVLTQHHRMPGGGPEDVDEQAHQGGLPGAIRADDPEDGPDGDLEVEGVEGADVPEVLGEGVGGNRRHAHHTTAPGPGDGAGGVVRRRGPGRGTRPPAPRGALRTPRTRWGWSTGSAGPVRRAGPGRAGTGAPGPPGRR